MTLGQWYHALKGLALGKYHTKFQLSSPKVMKVVSCKRNADVKLHLNLQVNLNLVIVCVEVLRPSQPNGVMSSRVSLPNHMFTGQAYSSNRLTSIVHILSPETDNCPS